MASFDIAIIGAGPGGYVAAIRAAQLGAKVALIERDEVGGVCLNRGCIPTKAMIASAHILRSVRNAPKYGIIIPAGEVAIDMSAIMSRKDQVVAHLRSGVATLLKGNGVELMGGSASFAGPNKISIDQNPIDAKNILIASGSSWIGLPNLKADGRAIATTDEVLTWTTLPKKIAIVGGGVVGCEFACMMRAFGAEVTIIEATPSILPPIEKAVSRLLARAMKGAGIEIITGTTVTSAAPSPLPSPLGGEGVEKAALSPIRGEGGVRGGVKFTLSTGDERMAEAMIVAVGRRALTQGLNVEAAGIALTERGFIKVDTKFKTSVDGVYAIGDVIGNPMLAHAASAEGIAAVENMLASRATGHAPRVYDPNTCPSPIFTSPEIGCVGQTSEELEKQGIKFKTGRFPYMASGKALCDGDAEGQAFIHADESGKILGAHIIGNSAATIIHEAAIAMRNGLTVKDLADTIHAHPTLSEVFAEAAEDVLGIAIHKGRTLVR